MHSHIINISNFKTKLATGFGLVAFLSASGTAAAAGGGAAGGAATEALTQATTVIQSGITLIVGVIAAIAFLMVAYAVLTKFNDARRGRGEWGEVIVPFVMGAAILVLIAWLVEQAGTAAGAIGAGAAAG